ncbi:MAG: NfeD family protein [Opitutales bacterium]|nr:NfeD family protein [Opitutales bacterium]
MDPAATTLFLVGLLLLAFEIVVPGGILGGIGAICMFAAAVVVWSVHGSTWGIVALFGGIVLAGLFFVLEIRILKSGPFARRFVLSARTPAAKEHIAEGIASGAVGRTVTRLNPSGQVMVEGRMLEALSRDGLIEAGVEVRIVSDDSFRVVVRKA